MAKKLGLEFSAAIPGSRGIVDRLRVTPSQPMEDGTLRDHVRNALPREPVLTTGTVKVWEKGKATMVRETTPESSAVIEVRVEDGVVTLIGIHAAELLYVSEQGIEMLDHGEILRRRELAAHQESESLDVCSTHTHP